MGTVAHCERAGSAHRLIFWWRLPASTLVREDWFPPRAAATAANAARWMPCVDQRSELE